MINALITWLVTAVLVMIGAYLIPGIRLEGADVNLFGFILPGLNVALIVALILGLLNAFVRPILGLIALPITVLTLGLFALVLNAAMVYLAAWVVTGFDVMDFWSALLFSIFMALSSALLGLGLGSKNV